MATTPDDHPRAPQSGTTILPGCEPWSSVGGPEGVLVLHGFTGSPQSVRGLAQAFAAAGFTVELPRLPGHGTSVDDLIGTGWDDWTAAAEAVYQDLAARCERVVVAGLSMGGTVTAWLASRHAELAGAVFVNPLLDIPEEVLASLEEMLAGTDRIPSIGGDVADPDARETAYDATPLGPLVSLGRGAAAVRPALGAIACPVLILTSAEDHVVEPSNSDLLAGAVSGPVERVPLTRSYHVATVDYDRDLIAERAVAFAQQVTHGVHPPASST